MFVRKNIERPQRRGLGKLLLFTMCLYMSSALAQEPAVDEVEPVQGEVTNTDTPSQPPAEASNEIIYKDQLPAEPENLDPGSAEQQVQEGITEPLSDDAPAAPAPAAPASRHIDRFGSSSTQEWEMDLSVPTPTRRAQPTSSELPDRAQNQELQSLLSSLAMDPGNEDIRNQLNRLLNNVLRQIITDLDTGMLDEAEQLISVIQPIEPTLPGLRTAQRNLRLLKESSELLASGNEALAANQLIQPENNNAYIFFTQAKAQGQNSAEAELGLTSVQEGLIARAMVAADAMDFDLAEQWLGLAEDVRDDHSLVEDARARLAAQQSGRGDELAASVNAAIDSGDYNMADFLIIDLIALGGHEQSVATLRAQLKEARYYSGFQPGQIISDPFLDGSDKAPNVVIVPSGTLMMGSEGSYDNEQPRHRVNIERGFGIGVTEVTVSQFRLFVLRSGYRTVAEIGGSSKIYSESAGRLSTRDNVTWLDGYNGDRANINSPVLHVSWHDAQAYVQWLSMETGKNYRLPTEIEYEYVARAGGNSNYWWGEGIPTEAVENLTGEDDESPGDRQWTTFFEDYEDGFWGPAPVGSLKSQLLVHPFGVSDIAGNVSEWVEDCWHPNYTQAPVTNMAWVNLGCERRVARGGYWASAPKGSRASFRISANPNTVGPVVGIRIARDL